MPSNRIAVILMKYISIYRYEKFRWVIYSRYTYEQNEYKPNEVNLKVHCFCRHYQHYQLNTS
jgi:hypothetical protein